MGLISLRHAYSRFLRAEAESRGGKRRELTKEDFSRMGASFLREKAQFDYLVERPDPPHAGPFLRPRCKRPRRSTPEPPSR
jgi:hypothetical protein